jgi:hypothetical protein
MLYPAPSYDVVLIHRTYIELAVVQLSIKTAGGEQFFMIALFHDVAVFHDEDQIRITNGG